MMMLTPLLLAIAPAPTLPPHTGDLLAIRARHAETISDGAMEHCVILIEGGKITAIGEDLPIERGVPVWDLPDDWIVMPGLVNAYTRLGLDGSGFNDSRPDVLASDELYPASEIYGELLKFGVTTLGLYPAGNGIPGQAVAVQTAGDTKEEMILKDNAYVKILLRSNGSSKKMISGGFSKVDDHDEKEKKNREKWDKAQEKKKKSKSKKKDDEEKSTSKDDDKKDDKDSGEYKPLVPDAKIKPFMELRDGSLRALISISSAGDYAHLLDAIGEEEFSWDLRIPLSTNIDIFYVKEEIGERNCRVVFEPMLTLHPGTMRQRNLPAEFSRAGAKLVLQPRSQSISGHENWLRNVGEIVAAGLDRDVALRAMTLEPAEMMGIGERVGSLSVGSDANLIFLGGDPFEANTKLKAVMLGGKVVSGELEH